MTSKKILPCGTLALGIPIFITGIVFIVMYISQAVIARLGEPDQSLLFWYLPLLFIGIVGIGLGIGMSILGTMGLRRIRRQDEHIATPPGTNARDG